MDVFQILSVSVRKNCKALEEISRTVTSYSFSTNESIKVVAPAPTSIIRFPSHEVINLLLIQHALLGTNLTL